MKSKHITHHALDAAMHWAERHTNGFHDAHLVTKKALERWENEGGKIPELEMASSSDSAASAGRF